MATVSSIYSRLCHSCAGRSRSPGTLRERSAVTYAARVSESELASMSNEELKDQLRLILEEPQLDEGELKPYDGISVDELAERFTKEPFIEIGEGPGGFPFVLLRHDSGCEAMVHLHGGAVTSWTDKDALEMLFVHPDNNWDPCEPIRGGLGIAFPQYANGLPGMKHRDLMPFNGFMNIVHFTLIATHCIDIDIEKDACPGVSLFAASDEYTETMFPHQWEMLYQVNLMDAEDEPEEPDPNRKTSHEVVEEIEQAHEDRPPEPGKKKKKRGKKKAEPKDPTTVDDALDILQDLADDQLEDEERPAQLQICMSISNTGEDEFSFQAAAVADFAVKDMNHFHESVRLVGLGNKHALDLKDSRRTEVIFNDMPFTHPIPRPDETLNWVYVNTNKGDVYFCPGNRQYYSFQWRQGFSDCIVAHPGVFEGAEWATCLATVGAGKVGVPVVLKPGETWHAEFSFRKHYHYWPTLSFEDYGMPSPEFDGSSFE